MEGAISISQFDVTLSIVPLHTVSAYEAELGGGAVLETTTGTVRWAGSTLGHNHSTGHKHSE